VAPRGTPDEQYVWVEQTGRSEDARELAFDEGGRVWWAEGDRLVSMDPATGIVTEHPLPTAGAIGSDLVLGPDGNLWALEGRAASTVARYPPA
jgi:streptogramin lyase